MKKWFLNFAASAVVMLAFTACEKDESKVTLNTAAAPVLTSSATSATLSQTTASATAVTYTWKAADFGFTAVTGYTLQFDKKGGNFSKPISLDNGAKTSRALTVSELNGIFIDLGLPTGTASQVDARVVASVGASAPSQMSAITTIAATPYSFCVVPTAKWSLIGPAGVDWNTDVMMTYDCAARGYLLKTTLNAGPFKFRANKDWSVNLGGAGNLATGAPLTLNGPDMTIATAGTYTIKLVVNTDAAGAATSGTVTVTP